MVTTRHAPIKPSRALVAEAADRSRENESFAQLPPELLGLICSMVRSCSNDVHATRLVCHALRSEMDAGITHLAVPVGGSASSSRRKQRKAGKATGVQIKHASSLFPQLSRLSLNCDADNTCGAPAAAVHKLARVCHAVLSGLQKLELTDVHLDGPAVRALNAGLTERLSHIRVVASRDVEWVETLRALGGLAVPGRMLSIEAAGMYSSIDWWAAHWSPSALACIEEFEVAGNLAPADLAFLPRLTNCQTLTAWFIQTPERPNCGLPPNLVRLRCDRLAPETLLALGIPSLFHPTWPPSLRSVRIDAMACTTQPQFAAAMDRLAEMPAGCRLSLGVTVPPGVTALELSTCLTRLSPLLDRLQLQFHTLDTAMATAVSQCAAVTDLRVTRVDGSGALAALAPLRRLHLFLHSDHCELDAPEQVAAVAAGLRALLLAAPTPDEAATVCIKQHGSQRAASGALATALRRVARDVSVRWKGVDQGSQRGSHSTRQLLQQRGSDASSALSRAISSISTTSSGPHSSDPSSSASRQRLGSSSVSSSAAFSPSGAPKDRSLLERAAHRLAKRLREHATAAREALLSASLRALQASTMRAPMTKREEVAGGGGTASRATRTKSSRHSGDRTSRASPAFPHITLNQRRIEA